MADKIKYSQKAIDAALDEIGDIVTALSESDKEVKRLIAGLVTRIASIERHVGLPPPAGDQS